MSSYLASEHITRIDLCNVSTVSVLIFKSGISSRVDMDLNTDSAIVISYVTSLGLCFIHP